MKNKPPNERFQRKYQLLKEIILMEQKFIIFMETVDESFRNFVN